MTGLQFVRRDQHQAVFFIESNLKANFNWSLKPIIFLAKFLGIQLDRGNNCRKSQIFLFSLAVIVFLVTSLHFIYFKIMMFHFESHVSTERKKVLTYLGIKISRILKDFFRLAIPISLFVCFSFTKTAKKIWATLEEIQRDLQLTEDFHRKVRKQCYIGIFALFLVRMHLCSLLICSTVKKYLY